MRRKFVTCVAKIVAAGLLAWLCLTLFCMWYYNIPVHAEDVSGATDYKWEENAFHSRATEGFSFGTTNNEGFNNLYDYEVGMEVDVLVMGSSHMEGFNVDMSETTASRLDVLMENDTVYNIGISGHTLPVCLDNLSSALEKYNPEKYLIIETDTIEFSDEILIKAINDNTEEKPSHTGGIIGLLQKNQYLRLAYKQLSSFIDNNADNRDVTTDNAGAAQDTELLIAFVDKIAATISDWQSEGGTLIIAYHPSVVISEDGTLQLNKNEQAVQEFAQLCEARGILFLDISDRILEEYAKDYTLPYGFSNSSVGKGHMNKYGHAMMAEELYKLMKEAE